MIIMLVNNNFKTKAFFPKKKKNKDIKVVEYWKNIINDRTTILL